MAEITYRRVKGHPLTNDEVDDNFLHLEEKVENLGDVAHLNTTNEEGKFLSASGEWEHIPKYSLATSQEDGLMSSQDKVRMLALYDDYIDRFRDLTKAIKLVYSEDVTIPSDSTFEVIYEGIEWGRGVTIPKNTPVFIRNFDGSSEFNDLFQRQYVSEIIYWGSDITRLSLIGGAALSKVPSTIPNALKDMSQMFEGCLLFNQDISMWAVGANITEMSSMFKDCSAFNQNLSSWNGTSAWHREFALGAGFENNPEKHPLWASPIEFEVWREDLPPKYVATTSAEDDTFYEKEGLWFYVAPTTTNESQLTELRDIVELYTDLEGDFPNADITDKYGVTKPIPLNQIVMSHVTSTYYSFYNRLMFTLGNNNFNQYIGSWDLSNVTNAYNFLQGCTSFNQPLNLDLPSCTNANFFLYECTSFNQPLDITLPSCTKANSFLQDCSSFNQPLNLDLPSCTNVDSFLYGCTSFDEPLEINLPSCTNASYFLAECQNFNQPLDITLPSCTNAYNFLQGCTSFNQPLDITLPNCTNAYGFLYGCTSFNQPLNLDLPSCTNANSFLRDCSSFDEPLEINLPSCTNVGSFLYGCTSFNQPLNLDLPSCTNASYFLSECQNFNQPLDITLPNCTNAYGFLYGCSNFNQDISNACVTKLTAAPPAWNTNTTASFQNDTSKHPVWGTCPSN